MYVHHVIFHYHLFKNKFNTCYCFLPFHLIISHVSSIYLLVWNFVQLITTLKRRKHKLFGHETLGQVHRSCTLPCQWTWRCPWPADLVPQPAALHACVSCVWSVTQLHHVTPHPISRHVSKFNLELRAVRTEWLPLSYATAGQVVLFLDHKVHSSTHLQKLPCTTKST